MALVETTVSGGAKGHYGSRMTALILLLVALREGSGTIIVWRQRLLLAATNYQSSALPSNAFHRLDDTTRGRSTSTLNF